MVLAKTNIEWIKFNGLSNYEKSMNIMQTHLDNILQNEDQEKILLLEYSDVYTYGSSASKEELLNPGSIPVVPTNRGGKFTYHGPGQRIIYPIFNLALPNRTKDIKEYVLNLEQWIIKTLQEFDIDSFRTDDRVGVWVLDKGLEKKIGSIGVRVKRWMTYHGVSINLNVDLEKFTGIVPCGITDYGVTSASILGKNITLQEFDEMLQKHYSYIFN
jgi:lipoyl(octanoyl) transferase